MWANFHSHSKYCDGKGELKDFLVSARKHQLFTIGFSSHAPVPFECKWCMKEGDLPFYLKEINDLKREYDIEIYQSLEIDYVPDRISPAQFREQLDYTIGSIHFVDQFDDGKPWEIDNTHAVFRKGLEKIFRNNFREAVHRYFELTREMINSAEPDIIGHLDKIKMQNIDGKFFSESDSWYREEVEKTLKLIESKGTIVEVNTRGIYQKKTSTTYPSPWILDLIHRKNIPVTISSDAHHPDDLINQFPETARLLQKTGFRNISVMTGGEWKQLLFNENGIIR